MPIHSAAPGAAAGTNLAAQIQIEMARLRAKGMSEQDIARVMIASHPELAPQTPATNPAPIAQPSGGWHPLDALMAYLTRIASNPANPSRTGMRPGEPGYINPDISVKK